MKEAPRPAGDPQAIRPFELPGFSGEVLGVPEESVEEVVRRCTDPSSALETLHWGRNYLYRVDLDLPEGRRPVAVKQFRNQSPRARADRRLRGSKAARSWRMACAMAEAGLATASPVAWIESEAAAGPSFFVTAHLEKVVELRYLLRARHRDALAEEFPWCDFARLVEQVGAAARRLHDAGIRHRDLSIGNVLVRIGASLDEEPETFLIDLNRARAGQRLGLWARSRDICRLELLRAGDRELLLRGYWGERVPWLARAIYQPSRAAYRLKHQLKNALRSPKGPRSLLPSKAPHVHIEAAPAGAEVRDRVVWDPLTEQPHQHASRLDRMRVRIADAPRHLAAAAVVLGHLPAVLRRLRALRRRPFEARPWPGTGVGLRPWQDRQALVELLEELGIRQVLLRLYPWQREHSEEEALARELAGRGFDLAYALPQNRDLVRDRARWEASIEELAERFLPYGRSFQIGQAINRSKWGVWSPQEYLDLATRAAAILRRRGEVILLGPSVIDFEPHATAAALLLPQRNLRFDGVASLLYVDRRGAPESPQLGLDAEGKALVQRALAELSPRCGERSWITEYNWPLREGPHSPAGRDVAVDEESQADYLVRFVLATLATGAADRAYWWQLVARGYGLVDPAGDGLRRRPAFRALRHLESRLAGGRVEARLQLPAPLRGFEFRVADGSTTRILWSTAGPRELELPWPVSSLHDRDGAEIPAASGRLAVGPSPIYVGSEG